MLFPAEKLLRYREIFVLISGGFGKGAEPAPASLSAMSWPVRIYVRGKLVGSQTEPPPTRPAPFAEILDPPLHIMQFF
jgi:hypothetical protein